MEMTLEQKIQEFDLKLSKIIDIKSLTDNSVIVFSINELTPEIYETINSLNYIYGDYMKQKNITYLAIKPGTEISVLDEKKMNSMGWYKKGLIIT